MKNRWRFEFTLHGIKHFKFDDKLLNRNGTNAGHSANFIFNNCHCYSADSECSEKTIVHSFLDV